MLGTVLGIRNNFFSDSDLDPNFKIISDPAPKPVSNPTNFL
jgi:hypothetical protein